MGICHIFHKNHLQLMWLFLLNIFFNIMDVSVDCSLVNYRPGFRESVQITILVRSVIRIEIFFLILFPTGTTRKMKCK